MYKLTIYLFLGRLLQGENTPAIFGPPLGNEVEVTNRNESEIFEVLNEIEPQNEKLVQFESKNEKHIQFEGFDEPLDGYFWLNHPSQQGFCVASNPGLYYYRQVHFVTQYF